MPVSAGKASQKFVTAAGEVCAIAAARFILHPSCCGPFYLHSLPPAVPRFECYQYLAASMLLPLHLADHLLWALFHQTSIISDASIRRLIGRSDLVCTDIQTPYRSSFRAVNCARSLTSNYSTTTTTTWSFTVTSYLSSSLPSPGVSSATSGGDEESPYFAKNIFRCHAPGQISARHPGRTTLDATVVAARAAFLDRTAYVQPGSSQPHSFAWLSCGMLFDRENAATELSTELRPFAVPGKP